MPKPRTSHRKPSQSSPPSFGEWLQQRRTLLGLLRKEFAEITHFAAATIKGYELDTRHPSISAAKTLAEAVRLPPNLLPVFIAFSRGDLPTPELLHLVQLHSLSPPTPTHISVALPFAVPAPVTALLGRANDLTQTLHLLQQPIVRLLTVVGPPGVGKTRFGLELAHALREPLAGAVFFVALAPVSRGEDIPQALCDVVLPAYDARQNSESDALTALKRVIADKRILLILDNFEHVLSDMTARLVSDLLASVPGIKLIITSREVLKINGEHRLMLNPLGFPTAETQTQPPAQLRHYAAIALFVERAQAILPKFELTEANALDVSQLCAMLDGLPLAIEIAASHLDHAALPKLLQQLETDALAMQHVQRDVTQRHRSLHTLIAHSYNLLATEQRQVFCALSVFASSADDTAVAAVITNNGRPRPHTQVLDHLHALAAKSLIKHEIVDNALRFSMLETLRDYGLDALKASGQEYEHRRRHAQYFLAFAQQTNNPLRDEQYVFWMNQCELNHNNCRAALLWCLQHDTELGLELATAWSDFWFQRGHIAEGFDWLSRLLGLMTGKDHVTAVAAIQMTTRTQAYAMCALTKYAWQTDTGPLSGKQIIALLEGQCLPLFRQHGDVYGEAVTKLNMGDAHSACNEETEGRMLIREALMTLRTLDRNRDIVAALNWLVSLLLGVDVPEALACAEEAVTRSQKEGNPSLIAQSLSSLSVAHRWAKNYTRAVEAGQEAAIRFRQINDKLGLQRTLIRLALALTEIKRFDNCRSVLQEYLEIGQQLGLSYVALTVYRQLGQIAYLEDNMPEALRQLLMSAEDGLSTNDQREAGLSLMLLVPVLAQLSNPQAAVQIAAATQTLFATLDHAVYPHFLALMDEGLALAHQQLDAAALAVAQAKGRSMSLEQAVAEVREVAATLSNLEVTRI